MLRHTPRKSTRSSRRAFTLIELLAVIAIIGVLASLTLVGLGRIRDSARGTKCTSNLRQIGGAFQLYAADNRGVYPALRGNATGINPNPSGGNWMREISPYVFRDVNSSGQVASTADIKKAGESSNIIHCPSYDLLFPIIGDLVATPYQTSGYGMNAALNIPGVGGSMTYDNRYKVASLSYPARTVLVGDSVNYHLDVQTPKWTTATNTVEGYYSGAPTRHGATANYLFADGHVSALTPDQALTVLPPRS
ncbi:MAG: DUF1559 domain-containing protein [Rariglobus sp.]|nr:DUF1559 domain-containing protein [Rariglobus sp.]